MPSITATGFKALAISVFLVAVLGGIWRGVASCGGHAWHDQAMLAALVIAATSLVLFAPNHRHSTLLRASLAVAAIAIFYLVRALSAPFYPAFPGFGDYFRQVGLALTMGPC